MRVGDGGTERGVLTMSATVVLMMLEPRHQGRPAGSVDGA